MRQLSLFKGKRQRGLKAPPPLEFHTHVQLADLLRLQCSKLWRYTHIPLGEYREKITAMRLQRMGTMPGWPDFLFAGPRGHVVFLELKRQGSWHFTDAQKDLQSFLCAAGHTYIAANDLKIAVGDLQDLGILPRSIEVR